MKAAAWCTRLQIRAKKRKMPIATQQYIAFGLLMIVSAIGAFSYSRLIRNLERYEEPQWTALGRPRLFNLHNPKSMREEFRFFWYVLSRQYRASDIPKIRIFGNVELACLLAAWTIAFWSIVFGDLNALQFEWRFG
jgi:hypothetical protein